MNRLSTVRPPAHVFNFEDRKQVSALIKQKFEGQIITFSELNYNVTNLDEQLAQAKDKPISLFLVDINLKPGDSSMQEGGGYGLKIIRQIKNKIKSKAMIIAYSTDNKYEEGSKEHGAEEFIHKNSVEWDQKLERVKSTFLMRYNDAANVVEPNGEADTAPEGTPTETLSSALEIVTETVLAWIRDVDEENGRVEIECEIKGQMEKRYIASKLLQNLGDLYSGQPITIFITHGENISIKFDNRDEPDNLNHNPFSGLEGSSIFNPPEV